MKRKGIKFIISALVITMSLGLLVGCGNKQENKEQDKKELSGNITSLGSSALQPLVEQGSKQFMQKNPDATINVQGGGSGAGINQVVSGSVEIGNSDVTAESKLKDKNQIASLVDHKVCAIGFGMIVNKDVQVDSLTKQQIQKIFTGEITNWKDVGGKDEKINVINRSKSSGTRATFKDTIMDGKDEKEGLGTTQDSSGSVVKAISETKGSISYVAFSHLNDEVKPLKINGIEPTKENIVAKKYSFWSYEHMYTKGQPTGLTKAFIDYMMSNEAKPLIEKLKYIPAGDIK
ncbi:phosphate ABC transporter substrate-binding protein [Clostridium sp. Marseille-Q2269]|uniref:phosphate ABC transporter substrate-binding protein n=1 Tax=Clostridium sp. Marseille-Q2269 TaxID=2942205 RepID=UPI0020748AD7|nr:phosphate ABC transporter substrate-binding protein [Clostridium sp. Marseille-Q2269]